MSETKEDTIAEEPAPEVSAEESELRAAQAKLRAFRAKRDADTLATRQKAEAAQTLLRLENEETIAKFEDELGAENLKSVFFAKGVAIVKRPKHGVWVAYRNKGKDDYHSHVALVSECLVHPKMDTLEEWLKTEPFKVESLAGCIGILAGIVVDDSLAK